MSSFGASSCAVPEVLERPQPRLLQRDRGDSGLVTTEGTEGRRGAGGRFESPRRWGSCTLKCKPAFQCKCCERLGPIKACGQGGAWPRDTAPQGAQVSVEKEGRPPHRDTRPGTARHGTAQHERGASRGRCM